MLTLKLLWKPLAVIALLGLLEWGVLYYGRSQYHKGVTTTETKYALEQAKRNEVERAREQTAQERLNNLERKALDEQAQSKIAVDNARSDAERLRLKADGLAKQLRQGTGTTSGTDEAAAEGWALFGRCTQRYAAMGEIADSQRNDLARWQNYGTVITKMKEQD